MQQIGNTVKKKIRRKRVFELVIERSDFRGGWEIGGDNEEGKRGEKRLGGIAWDSL